MPRRASDDKEPGFVRQVLASHGFPIAGAACIALALLFTWYSAESYLSGSPRFTFRLPELAVEEGDLRVIGAVRASPRRVRAVFREDNGRSLYHMPLATRREQVKNVEWVKDATLIRRWPNRVDVLISEREPVAFTHIPRGRGSTRPALIDAEGVILPVPDRRRYDLPVLLGVREDQSLDDRRLRVRMMQHFYREAAPTNLSIPEVDLKDASNLKCRVNMGDSSVVLWLGDADFEANLRRYMAHREEILRRLPGAAMLDLRLPDRITAAVDEKGGD